jgi:hypothetical protein
MRKLIRCVGHMAGGAGIHEPLAGAWRSTGVDVLERGQRGGVIPGR